MSWFESLSKSERLLGYVLEAPDNPIPVLLLLELSDLPDFGGRVGQGLSCSVICVSTLSSILSVINVPASY